jgi:glucose/arabinose dehydrogenase
LLVLASLMLSANPAWALPDNFWYENTIEGLQLPTAVQFARDGRVFIAEKRGVIKVYDDLRDTEPTVFADLRTAVHNHLDRGLLGLALHPEFPDQPYVYITYAYDGGMDVDDAPRWGTPDADDDPCPSSPGCPVSARLSRLTADGDFAVEETVLIRDWYQQFPNHSIGGLLFGADGYLYVGAGEGATAAYVDHGQTPHPLYPDLRSPIDEGGAMRSQDLETTADPVGLSGSIIRVDPATGLGAPDNPLAGDIGSNAGRIVAYGLRNPYRFAERPGTNELWIADVGWEDREEINVLPDPASAPAPLNFGWPCFEGEQPQSGYAGAALPICQRLYAGDARFPHVLPWREFERPQPGEPDDALTAGSLSAITFYRGPHYPVEYHGGLFFADYVTGRIYVVRDQDGDGVPDGPDAIDVFANGAWGIVSLTPGPAGDLFFTQIFSGRLVRIRYGDNVPPVALLALTPGSEPQGPPRTIGFDASSSYDPDNAAPDALTFEWDLQGDGVFEVIDSPATSTVARAFDEDGSYQVGVRVTDTGGVTDTRTVRITVGDAFAQANIESPAVGQRWRSGETVHFAASGSEADGTPLPADAYQWSVTLLHCVSGPNDCHQHPMTGFSGRTGSLVAPVHEYPSYLQITLAANTSEGVLTVQRRLDPLTAQATLATEPMGLRLGFGSGDAQPTPFTRTVIVGSDFTVSAPAIQRANGVPWQFESWSDGGDRQHLAVAGAAGPLTLVATYVPDPDAVFGDGFEGDQ